MAYLIEVSGIVQGVGFRPFVYRIAKRVGLRGYVRNLGNYVEILAECDEEKLRRFLDLLRKEKPPLARIEDVRVREVRDEGYDDFYVIKSGEGEGSSIIPPDINVCDKCLEEMFDPRDRRYLFPFITCTDCGPRFTIVTDVPYDRINTTMIDFPLCEDCEREYTNPMDRRYKAEPLSCWKCGPRYFLYDNSGRRIEVDDPISEAARLIEEGHILAIKGIGGTHLATLTTDDEVVLKLRRRRRRPNRPFAVMARNLDVVRKFAVVSKEEEELLTSFRRPIVLLRKSDDYYLSEYVAPGLHTIGVMLPYSPFHYLLMRNFDDPIIMTSANYPGEPMVLELDEALRKLGKVADYFLFHNRRIANRCDDSVIRISGGEIAFIRRSRGYVPEPIDTRFKSSVIATGPDLSSTGAVMKKGRCYLTQHIGDVENLETLEFLESAIRHMMKLTRTREIDAVACDLHPMFPSTTLAESLSDELGVELFRVQHHHAHAATLLAEHGLDRIVAITCDGVGYGLDGQPWGGEVLLSTYSAFERIAHLKPQPMPGGDLAAKYPARMVLGILYEALGEDVRRIAERYLLDGFKRGIREIEFSIRQLEKGINTPWTSSTGRVLDALSALLGVCYYRSYDGEPAMKLEAFATRGDPRAIRIEIDFLERNGVLMLDTTKMLLSALEALERGERREDIAASFQRALAEGLYALAMETCFDERDFGFSGGVALNDFIATTLRKLFEESGKRFFLNKLVPRGDGGVSFGQACVAAARVEGIE